MASCVVIRALNSTCPSHATSDSGAGPTRVRRRDLFVGAVLAAMATAAAVAVPLGYGGVVNGACFGSMPMHACMFVYPSTHVSLVPTHNAVLLLPTETPLALRRQQLVRALQVRPYKTIHTYM